MNGYELLNNNELVTPEGKHIRVSPKLVTMVIDRDNAKKVEKILREKHVHFHFMSKAVGTASSEILNTFGLSGTKKTVCLCLDIAERVDSLVTTVVERLNMTELGNGIVFVVPISSIGTTVSKLFAKDVIKQREKRLEYMEKEIEKIADEARHELILAVINNGYSENVMDAARENGARGGTIIHARHSGLEEAVKFYGISIQEEKEIVMILVKKEQKKDIMKAINHECGLKTEAQGIVFSLPVESCAGIEAMNDFDEE